MQTAPIDSSGQFETQDPKQKINLTSLNVVRDELVITIEQAATHLEGFVSDRENSKLLQSCIQSLKQIRGSLDLIELHGACELAGELLSTAELISKSNEPLEDAKLSSLTKGFFVLSCYFEYALLKEKGMPALLIPYINELKVSNRQPILWESYFSDAKPSYRVQLQEKPETIPESDSLEAIARRTRHMYQVGLLGFIKELRIQPSLQLMHRACDKILRHSYGTKAETFWWLFSNTVDAVAKADLLPTLERKRLFGQLDRQFKKVEKQGLKGFEDSIDNDLIKELAYYVALANIDEQPFIKIKASFGFATLNYDEEHRVREAKSLTGPSASTVTSVAETLKTELRVVKEVVEFASESGSHTIENYNDLFQGVTKIKDILDVIGLKSAAQTMSQQLSKIKEWDNTDDQIDAVELVEVADAFIYVESVLNSIEKENFSDEKLAEINELSRNQMIVKSHLAGAQMVVLEEAEAGLNMVKRALNSYSESSYDRAHIKNVSKTLNSIRGGMLVLELPRAAEIVSSFIKFIDGSLLSNNEPAALAHMLETFADAVICLEYYLGCLKVDKFTSPDTLVVAEESMAALGYGVTFSG